MNTTSVDPLKTIDKAILAGRIPLAKSLTRQNRSFDAIVLRQPMPEDMRGLALVDLLRMDVKSLAKLLPRISRPVLKRADIARMHPSDFMHCGAFVSNALLEDSQILLESQAEHDAEQEN